VVESEVDGCGTASVMPDRDNLFEVQRIQDRFEIAQLLPEAIVSAGGLVRSAVTEKIERNDPSPSGDQIWNQLIVDMQVIRKTVHENKGWPCTCIVASVDPSFFARDVCLGERHRIKRHALSFSFG
jgi:hypothetical protein